MPEPELHPVARAPWWEGTPPWPWRVASVPPMSWLRVSGGMEDEEVGSVMARLVGQPEAGQEWTIAAISSHVLAAPRLLLGGGIEATLGECAVRPGCCCGLENWREWVDGTSSGERPSWLGHDPDPWVEWGRDTVRVWSHGGLRSYGRGFAIPFSRGRLAEELEKVQRKLEGFVRGVGVWAARLDFPDPAALCRKIDAGLGITGPRA